jgi:hypothetical protein
VSDVDEERDLNQQATCAVVIAMDTIAKTGRCLCGRRPTLWNRLMGRLGL